MNHTVRCVSTHHEDLADGRVVEPGGRAENVDLTLPHNQRLLDESRIIVETSEPAPTGTVEDILAAVGDDSEKARAALEVEKAAAKPRSTLVDRLEAIVGEQPNATDEEVSE